MSSLVVIIIILIIIFSSDIKLFTSRLSDCLQEEMIELPEEEGTTRLGFSVTLAEKKNMSGDVRLFFLFNVPFYCLTPSSLLSPGF